MGLLTRFTVPRHQFPLVDASNTIRKWVGYPYDSCVNTVLMDIQGALRGGGTAADFSPLAVCKALTSDTVKASQHIRGFSVLSTSVTLFPAKSLFFCNGVLLSRLGG